ncbi:hypothetical protein AV530_000615 [Patagioenas fasciata monilis]|uniref:Uncharacterized protein n=1 Tax=Patagioenas fasciata monilis TaxID=372326 RepID=A0A1V4IFU9_PATFA|nr:hypothetical protein AV530_000615 [Patagioenas fasciata monilis]
MFPPGISAVTSGLEFGEPYKAHGHTSPGNTSSTLLRGEARWGQGARESPARSCTRQSRRGCGETGRLQETPIRARHRRKRKNHLQIPETHCNHLDR